MPSRNQVGPGNGHNQGQDETAPSRGGGGPNGGAGGYNAGAMVSFKPSAGQDGIELQASANQPPNDSDVSFFCPACSPQALSPKPLSTVGNPGCFEATNRICTHMNPCSNARASRWIQFSLRKLAPDPGVSAPASEFVIIRNSSSRK